MVSIVARNEAAGTALARQYGFQWKKEITNERPGLLINVTPVGMAGGAESDQLAFSRSWFAPLSSCLMSSHSPGNTADSTGDFVGKENSHGRAGHRASSSRTVCALHRRSPRVRT
mgnify:CR=1 FL=1